MKKIDLDLSVRIALNTLDEEGVRNVTAWFDRLRNWDSDEFVRRNSVGLERVPGAKMLKTTTDLRIFFRIDGDTVTILDVARLATILAYGATTGT